MTLTQRRIGTEVKPLRLICGTAFGSFGELLQGVLPDDDVDFLVTFPIDRGSRVRFRLDQPSASTHACSTSFQRR